MTQQGSRERSLAAIVCAMVLTGCASTGSPHRFPSEGLLLEVTWVGDGPAPIGASVRIERDGRIRQTYADTELQSHHTPLELRNLTLLVKLEEMRQAESAGRAFGYRSGCCDSAEVGFRGDLELDLPCSIEAPPVLRDLIERVNAAVRRHFGDRELVPAGCLSSPAKPR